MQHLKHLIIPFFILLMSISANAQNISGIDFNTLKADDLTDEQILELFERMEERGLSIAEVEAMAIARGTSPVEVAKLRNRLNEIRNSALQNGTAPSGNNRSRSLSNQMQEPSPGQRPIATADTLNQLLGITKKDSFKVFGSNIFSNRNISFSPSLNIATPSNYVLGPGDELIVDIWGASENTYQLPVSPEGSVQISNVGPVHVSGLTIEEATKRLTDRLAGIYSGIKGSNPNTFMQVTLGDIRSIKVSIVGEVNTPGTYTMTSLSTVFNALYAAGGPDKNGTYRSIKVLREEGEPLEVDLYDFLTAGDLSGNISLRDQDIIKVDPYLNRITVKGELKRTGLFETKDGESLADLISFTGGFTQFAYQNRIKIERTTPTEKKIIDVSYPQEADIELQSGDIITVGKVLDRFENKITIEGPVFRPGEYQLEDNSTLFTLIQNAQGLMGDAFLDRAIIYRTKPDYSIEAISVNLSALLENPEQNDVQLQKDDLVKISSIFELQEFQTVKINGSVNAPGTYPYAEHISLKDLILEADGMSDEATPFRIEVARRVTDKTGNVQNEIAEIFTINIPNGLTYHPELEDIVLQPYDQVFVRKSPSYETQSTVTITGEVLYPGTYVLSRRDFKLSDLIRASGGLTPYAFTEGASLKRQFSNIIDELELNLADTIAGREIESLSQVGIHLDEALQHPGSDHDMLLHAGDVIEVPKRLETVQIRGEVLYPVNTRFVDGRSFRSYIAAAGGLTEDANKNKAYIVYANGEVDRTKRFLFFKSYPEVRPGAVLIIPPEEERQRLSTAERITVMSTIVSLAAIVTNTIFQIRNSNN